MVSSHKFGPDLLIALALAVLSGMASPASGQDFGSLAVPRPNALRQPVRLARPPRSSLDPLPPRSHALAVRVLQGGGVLRGSYSGTGRIAGTAGNVISFDPAKGGRITIGFALPGTSFLKNLGPGTGKLTVNDLGSPFAADQNVEVKYNSTVLAWYIWQSRSVPFALSLPDSVGSVTQHVGGDAVIFATRGRTWVLKSGQSGKFTWRGVRYTFYVQTAMRQAQGWTREGDGARSTYVLKAIVYAE